MQFAGLPLQDGDLAQASPASAPFYVQDGVQRAGRLGRDDRLPHARQCPQGDETGRDVGGRVGVNGSPTSLMPGVEGRQHVPHLGAAAHSEHDPVGAHAHRGSDELAHGDFALPLDVGAADLEVDDVRVGGAELRGLLDHEDAFACGDFPEDRRQKRRLPRPRGPRDDDVRLAFDHCVHDRADCAGERPHLLQFVEGVGHLSVRAEGDERPLGGEGRQHRVKPQAAAERSVDYGA